MADLIDREELLDELNWLKSQKSPSQQDEINDIIMRVKSQYHRQSKITVTMVEPKRGEWEFFVEKSFNGEVVEVDDCGWRCSHCKTLLADAVGGYWDDDSEKPTVNFCPNCGADMRDRDI